MSGLRTLPPEIRKKIFTHVDLHFFNKMPNLIIALRPDKTMYHEALALFYKTNVYYLWSYNGFSFGPISEKAMETIIKTRVVIFGWELPRLEKNQFAAELLRAHKLQEVYFRDASWEGGLRSEELIYSMLQTDLTKTLRKITLAVGIDPASAVNGTNDALERLQKKLGAAKVVTEKYLMGTFLTCYIWEFD